MKYIIKIKDKYFAGFDENQRIKLVDGEDQAMEIEDIGTVYSKLKYMPFINEKNLLIIPKR